MNISSFFWRRGWDGQVAAGQASGSGQEADNNAPGGTGQAADGKAPGGTGQPDESDAPGGTGQPAGVGRGGEAAANQAPNTATGVGRGVGVTVNPMACSFGEVHCRILQGPERSTPMSVHTCVRGNCTNAVHHMCVSGYGGTDVMPEYRETDMGRYYCLDCARREREIYLATKTDGADVEGVGGGRGRKDLPNAATARGGGGAGAGANKDPNAVNSLKRNSPNHETTQEFNKRQCHGKDANVGHGVQVAPSANMCRFRQCKRNSLPCEHKSFRCKLDFRCICRLPNKRESGHYWCGCTCEKENTYSCFSCSHILPILCFHVKSVSKKKLKKN